MKKIYYFLLAVCLLTANVAFAQDAGSFTIVDGDIQINSQEDFDKWIVVMNETEDYYDQDVDLNADVEVDSTYDSPFYVVPRFNAEFNGNGHRLTLNLSTSENEHEAGLTFIQLLYGTVKNLYVDGTIESSVKCMGPIAKDLCENSVVENVCSTVDIVSGTNGDGTHGGIAGCCTGNSTIRNVVFAGSIKGEETHSCAGFVGWNSSILTVENSLMIANIEVDHLNSNTICRGSLPVCKNVFSHVEIGQTPDGCSIVTAEQLESGAVCYALNGDQKNVAWYQNIGEDAIPVLDNSHKQVYASGEFTCNGLLVGEGTFTNEVTESNIPDHSYSCGVCESCGHVIPNFVTQDAEGFYIVDTPEKLVYIANYATANPKTNIRITADLDMVGVTEKYTPITNSYSGIFDGGGHTISNLVISRPNSINQGLIGVAGNCTIKNLTLDASCSIEGASYTAGFVGKTTGMGTITFENVYMHGNVTCNGANGAAIYACNMGSTMTVVMTNCGVTGNVYGEREAGALSGWVGAIGRVTIENCWFVGTIEGYDNERAIFCRPANDVNLINCWSSFGSHAGVGKLSEDAAATGELTWLLNGQSFVNPTWYQNLVEGDLYPSLDSSRGIVFPTSEGYTSMGSDPESFKAFVNTCVETAYKYVESEDVQNYANAELLQNYVALIEQYRNVPNMAVFSQIYNAAVAKTVELDSSVQAYKAYDAAVQEMFDVLERSDDFSGDGRDFLESVYLGENVGPGVYEGAPNGTYAYIMEKRVLSTDLVYAEINWLKELFRIAVADGYKPGCDFTIVDGNIQINSQEDFDKWIVAMNETEDYFDQDVDLNADVEVASTSNSPFYVVSRFNAEFNGNGHKLTLNLSTSESEHEAGLTFIRELYGTVKNLYVAGTIESSVKCMGPIARDLCGNSVVENVCSTVDIVSGVDGDGSHGGIAGRCTGNSTIRNVVFAGSIKGENTNSCAGFVGWNSANLTVENSLMIANIEVGHQGGNTICRGSAPFGNPVVCKNVYSYVEINETPDGCSIITDEQLASGAVCYALNGDQKNIAWYQNLNEDQVPVLDNTHKIVYGNGTTCDGISGLTYNNEEGTVEFVDHVFNENGVCGNCGASDPNFEPQIEYVLVNTPSELVSIANYATENPTVNIKITADLDMSEVSDQYVPISGGYSGIFDGGGHTISNLIINKPGEKAQALIGVAGECTIKNLTLDETCSITGGDMCAGFVGVPSGSGAITMENLVMHGNVKATRNAAGIFACNEGFPGVNVVIKNCGMSGHIEGGYENGAMSGWMGMDQSKASVTNCWFVGTIEGYEFEGNMFYRGSATATNCWSTVGSQNNVGKLSETAAASGELTWRLNGERSDDNVVWRQNLGEDATPTLDPTHKIVYMTEEGTFTNTKPETTDTVTPGDVNNDGSILVDDVVLTIDAVLGIYSEDFVFEAADMDGDGEILVNDVVQVINAVLGVEPATSKVRGKAGAEASETFNLESSQTGMALSLSNAANYVAMQYDMVLPEGVSLADIRLASANSHNVKFREMPEGVVRVVVASLGNETFKSDNILKMAFESAKAEEISIRNAFVVTRGATMSKIGEVKAVVNGNTTAIESIAGGFAKADVYDLNGRLVRKGATSVDGLKKGVYVINGKNIIVK